jgi:hypothetical protein
LLLLGWGFVRFGEMEECCLLLEHSASHTRNNTLPLPSNSWKLAVQEQTISYGAELGGLAAQPHPRYGRQ